MIASSPARAGSGDSNSRVWGTALLTLAPLQSIDGQLKREGGPMAKNAAPKLVSDVSRRDAFDRYPTGSSAGVLSGSLLSFETDELPHCEAR